VGRLSEAGFVSKDRAVASWLGVTQYLTLEAIKQTLEWVARLPAGSEIVLTFDVPCSQAESTKAILRARGIRFETFFEPDEMLALLGECGLAGEVFTPAQVDELYFRGRDDGLHAHTWEWLAVGRVE
jgi:O-methyltransferase involved in polyketide biosynthesis